MGTASLKTAYPVLQVPLAIFLLKDCRLNAPHNLLSIMALLYDIWQSVDFMAIASNIGLSFKAGKCGVLRGTFPLKSSRLKAEAKIQGYYRENLQFMGKI